MGSCSSKSSKSSHRGGSPIDRREPRSISPPTLSSQEEKERRLLIHDLRNVMNNLTMLFGMIRQESGDNHMIKHWCKLGEKLNVKLGAIGGHLTGHNFDSPMHTTKCLCMKIAKRGRRVLIVEDDSVTLDLLMHQCAMHKIPSHAVKDGSEALRYLLEGTPYWNSLRSGGGMPATTEADLATVTSRANVLFLDLFLPRIDGMSLLAKLDELGILPHMDVIVMYGQELSEDQARQLYAYTPNLLAKPLSHRQTNLLFD